MFRLTKKPITDSVKEFNIDRKGQLVGTAIGRVSEKTLILEGLYVHPDFRRRGFGDRLLRAVIDWGEFRGANTLKGEFQYDNGCRTVDEEFYQKHGIQIIGRTLHKDLR